MPYKVDVLIEKRIMLQTITGVYTLQDMTDAVAEFVQFLDGCEEKSGIILVSIEKMKSVENSLMKVRNVAAPMLNHPNIFMTVGYGNGDKIVVNFITNALTGLFKLPAKSFNNEDETVQFIISKCPELAESLPRALQEYHAKQS